jgi:hypothetical protein
MHLRNVNRKCVSFKDRKVFIHPLDCFSFMGSGIVPKGEDFV